MTMLPNTPPVTFTDDEEARIQNVAREMAKELAFVIANFGCDEKVIAAHIQMAIKKALK